MIKPKLSLVDSDVKWVRNPLRTFTPYALCPCKSEKKYKWCCLLVTPKYIKQEDLPEWTQLLEEAQSGAAAW